MNYPNNDLWTVREPGLLNGALEDMRNKKAIYYPNLEYQLVIPNVATYVFKGVLNFQENDRTIMFECGEGFGLSYDEIVSYLKKFTIEFTEIDE